MNLLQSPVTVDAAACVGGDAILIDSAADVLSVDVSAGELKIESSLKLNAASTLSGSGAITIDSASGALEGGDDDAARALVRMLVLVLLLVLTLSLRCRQPYVHCYRPERLQDQRW